jgi:hypothetical protein
MLMNQYQKVKKPMKKVMLKDQQIQMQYLKNVFQQNQKKFQVLLQHKKKVMLLQISQ